MTTTEGVCSAVSKSWSSCSILEHNKAMTGKPLLITAYPLFFSV